MKNPRIFILCTFLCTFLCFSSTFYAQQCNGTEHPESFSIIPDPGNPGQCFFQINWKPGGMPEIHCEALNTDNTTVPNGTLNGNSLKDLEFTLAGGAIQQLYLVTGNVTNCANVVTTDLNYGLDPNTFISTTSSADYCPLIGQEFTQLGGNQTGGSNFNCLLINELFSLPIELAYFNGNAMPHNNLLKWSTESEENVKLFTIEKSADGSRAIDDLGTLEATGFSNSTQFYHMEDRNPFPVTYYRLVSIDFDGHTEYSDWIAIERNKIEHSAVVEAFPVPWGAEPLQVYYETEINEKIRISLSEISGKIIFEESLNLEKGVHHWSFDEVPAGQGILVLKIQSRNGTQTKLIPRISGN